MNDKGTAREFFELSGMIVWAVILTGVVRESLKVLDEAVPTMSWNGIIGGGGFWSGIIIVLLVLVFSYISANEKRANENRKENKK